MTRWQATFDGGPHDGMERPVDGQRARPYRELRVAGDPGSEARVVYPADFGEVEEPTASYVLVAWSMLERRAQYGWAELAPDHRQELRRRELMPV